jgi:hypothetical protein
MSTPSRMANRGALPWGLLGMLGLVAACEQFCAGNEHDLSAAIPAGWRMAARAASGFMGEQGVVCFGDSQVKKGLMPAVLGERLGWPVFNLALTGGQPPSSYYLLRHTLAAGKRPEALVLDAYPGLLAADLRINIRQWPELLTLTETLELAWQSRDAKLVGFLALTRLFPSLKTREEIRTTFRSALRGEPNRTRNEVLVQQRAWWLDRGAEPAEPNPRFADQAPLLEPLAPGRSWKPKQVNVRYLRKFLALAAEREIPVFWLLHGHSPAWQAQRDALKLEEPYERLVRALQLEFTNLVVVDARRAGFESGLFADPVHLNRSGAELLSAHFAQVLLMYPKVATEHQRWVILSTKEASGRLVYAGEEHKSSRPRRYGP